MARENTIVIEMPPEVARQHLIDSAIGLALTLLILAATIWHVVRRRPPPDRRPLPRILRILYSAAGFSIVITFMLVAEYVWQDGDFDELLSNAVFVAVASMIVGTIMSGIADFWLGFRHPHRTRDWLVAAMMTFGAIIVAGAAFAVWLQGRLSDLLDWGVLQVPVLGAIAGALWWSCLPSLRSDLAELFE